MQIKVCLYWALIKVLMHEYISKTRWSSFLKKAHFPWHTLCNQHFDINPSQCPHPFQWHSSHTLYFMTIISLGHWTDTEFPTSAVLTCQSQLPPNHGWATESYMSSQPQFSCSCISQWTKAFLGSCKNWHHTIIRFTERWLH